MTTDVFEEVETVRDAGLGSIVERDEGRRTDMALAAIRADAERVKRREVAEAVRTLDASGDLDEAQRDAVEALADAVVDQLLAAPARSLRDADDPTTSRTALRLFDLEGEAPIGDPRDEPAMPEAER